jgi:hydroxymethylpyrimidine/phosphomethylpyrimidine kinase
MPTALTIAGSDPSGGAGIQADLKTFAALGVYGYSAITSVIAQSSASVGRIDRAAPAMVVAQIEAAVRERRPAAVKTGALCNAAVVDAVVRAIRTFKLPAPVVDPVIVASAGKRLIDKAGERAMRARLIPLACVVTPNIAEAKALTGVPIEDAESMREAARAIVALGARAAVIKGGHLGDDAPALDIFHDGRRFIELRSERIAGAENVHGTGCAFSAAIAAFLARGFSLEDSVRRAKAYLTRILKYQLKFSRRSRPMLDHFARR